MHSHRGRGRRGNNKRELNTFNGHNNFKKFRRFDYQHRNRSGGINSIPNRGGFESTNISMRRDLSQESEHRGQNVLNLGNDNVLICPSDDVYDAAYGDDSPNETGEKSNFTPPPSISHENLSGQFLSSQSRVPYVEDYDYEKRNFLIEAEHCKSCQPILFANNCCLYPPIEMPIDVPSSAGGYNHETCSVMVSNLPRLIDNIMVESIFTKFGQIDFLSECGEIQDGKKQQSFNIRYKNSNSACDAVRYNNHFVHIGGPDSIVTPDMLSKIKIEIISDSVMDPSPLLERNLEFSEINASRIISFLQNKVHLKESTETIINWLIAGECKGYNINTFLDLIANLNGFVPQIVLDNEDLNFAISKFKEETLQKVLSIKDKCDAVRSVIATCNIDKVWGAFNNVQRDFIQQCKEDFEKEFNVVESNLDEVVSQLDKKNNELNEIGSREDMKPKNPLWSKDYDSNKDRSEKDARERIISRLKEENIDLISQLADIKLILEGKTKTIIQLQIEADEKDQLSQDRKEHEKQICMLEDEIQALKKLIRCDRKIGLPSSLVDHSKKGVTKSPFGVRNNFCPDENQYVGPGSRMESSENGVDFDESFYERGERSSKIILKNENDKCEIKQESRQFTFVDEVDDDDDDDQQSLHSSYQDVDDVTSERQNDDAVKINIKQANRNNRRYRSNRKSPSTLMDKDVIKDCPVSENEVASLNTVKKEISSTSHDNAHRSSSTFDKSDCTSQFGTSGDATNIPINTKPISPNFKYNQKQNTVNPKQTTWEVKDVALLSTITIALNSYIQGATVDDLYQYCLSNKLDVTDSSITNLLTKFSNIFQRILDSSNCERWVYRGFDLLRNNIKEE